MNIIAIDLKSFFASVECVERGLDPLATNLVVADVEHTDKTICLAVTPTLKALGVPARPRLFEVKQIIQDRVPYIIATPRMRLYKEYSTRIFNIYQSFVSSEDIHVYSIDEVFIDVTSYLAHYRMTPRQLAMTMIREVLSQTGITATAGVGTNLYLAKVAMDVVAKHIPADADGVRIAELDELSYREQLWEHRPLTDFWRVGRATASKLAKVGLMNMGDIALCSLGRDSDYYNEALLYKLFGVSAEYLIDHAWGYEPCTIADIRAYRPQTKSLSTGQVLTRPYSHEECRLPLHEMAEEMALSLCDKRLVTSKLTLTVGYDVSSLTGDAYVYEGIQTETDRYGRTVPRHAHGTANLSEASNLAAMIIPAIMDLYERITNPAYSIRRLTIDACDVRPCDADGPQLDLFGHAKEQQLQEAVLSVKSKYGKNAILRASSLEEGATAIKRNGQIGGHRA